MEQSVTACASPQLFARLEARRCLKDIEPRLFPEDGGPDQGDCLATLTHSQLTHAVPVSLYVLFLALRCGGGAVRARGHR